MVRESCVSATPDFFIKRIAEILKPLNFHIFYKLYLLLTSVPWEKKIPSLSNCIGIVYHISCKNVLTLTLRKLTFKESKSTNEI